MTTIVMLVVAVLVLGVAATMFGFIVTQKPRAPEPAVALSGGGVRVAGSAQAPLAIHGITIEDHRRVDPTDLLVSVRARIKETEKGSEPKLVRIEVSGARDGVVALGQPATRISYAYALEAQDLRLQSAGELIRLTLDPTDPVLDRVPLDKTTVPVHEPTCVWSAAWRAARAAGLLATEVVDATYTAHPTSKTPIWTFVARERSDAVVRVDADSCAIKTL